MLEPRRRPDLQGARRRSAATACVAWEHRPGRAGQLHDGRVLRVQRGAQEGSAGDRGARAPRHPRHGPGAHRHLGLRRAARAREVPRPAGRLDRRLDLRRGGLQPLRQPGERAALRGRRQHARAARDRGRRATRTGRGRWASTCRGWFPGQRLRDDVKPLEIAQPRGRLVHARRQPAALAALVDAARLQPARGARDPHARLRGRRPPAAGRAPALVRRDGRARTGTRRTTTRPGRRSTSASGASAS